MLSTDKKRELIIKLYETGSISLPPPSETSLKKVPYVINLRLLNSYPLILKFVAGLFGSELQTRTFDLIAGPFTDIPLATTISLEFNWPMIFVREERKGHGTDKLVEGNFQPEQGVVVVDDEIEDVADTLQLLGRLEGSGLKIAGLFLLLDRGFGSLEMIRERGFKCEGLITLNDIFIELSQMNKIAPEQLKELTQYLASEKKEFLLRQKMRES